MFPPPPDESADFRAMFDAELLRVRAWRLKRNVPEKDGEGKLQLIGLAFSGGGIRSATFNLGVLQALAQLRILHFIDYLSTVSGGGYIGGWLAALIQRPGSGMTAVEDGLDPNQANNDSLPQEAIAHLRAYSNYLTPKVRALSADTWSLFSIWSRNTLLHLLTLVAAIASLILFGRFAGLNSLVLTHWTAPAFFTWLAFGTGAVTLSLTLKRVLPDKWCTDDGVQQLVVLPAMVGTLLMTFELYANPIRDWLPGGIILSILFVVLQFLAGFWGWFLHHHEGKLAYLWNVLLQLCVAAVSGFVTSWLFYGVSLGVENFRGEMSAPWLVLTVGPPAILAAVSLGVVLDVGLMGRDIPDSTREWLGRLGAWAMIYGAGWLLFFSVAFLGPLAIEAGGSAFAGWAKATITASWVGATAGSLLAAKSGKSGGEQSHGAMNSLVLAGPWIFLLGFVSLIGLGVHELTIEKPHATPPASAQSPAAPTETKVTQTGSTITVVVNTQAPPKSAVSVWDRYWGEMAAQSRSSLLWTNPQDRRTLSWYQGLLEVMLLAILIALVTAWRVDINEFSLHHFYKNRLARCYLGASRLKCTRDADPFTNFDLKDDIPLNRLDVPEFSGPFPIFNATLNLSSGRNLAWQERKGAPFIFTPLYCGYDTGRDDSGTSVSRGMRVGVSADAPASKKGYYPTQMVAKTKFDPQWEGYPGDASRFKNDGILLGTAVGISGAAASPNQGYHSSTAVAFMMTVFNVRLGWWLGNPTGPKPSRNGPVFGLGYTLTELFGTSTADSDYVNLSDGGHFDNMGLYELVRRRCRCIILCDAEQDGELAFGGLATAIRMCRTDFGAEIDINLAPMARTPDNQPERFSGCHFAIGEISYVDGTKGRLIYLKSSLTGDEPADILGYHRKCALFPHESTADQWFDESQFESYRKLGYHVAMTALRPLNAAKSRGEFWGPMKACEDPAGKDPTDAQAFE